MTRRVCVADKQRDDGWEKESHDRCKATSFPQTKCRSGERKPDSDQPEIDFLRHSWSGDGAFSVTVCVEWTCHTLRAKVVSSQPNGNLITLDHCNQRILAGYSPTNSYNHHLGESELEIWGVLPKNSIIRYINIFK